MRPSSTRTSDTWARRLLSRTLHVARGMLHAGHALFCVQVVGTPPSTSCVPRHLHQAWSSSRWGKATRVSFFVRMLVVSFTFSHLLFISIFTQFQPHPLPLVSHVLAGPLYLSPTILYAPILLNSMCILPHVPPVSRGTK